MVYVVLNTMIWVVVQLTGGRVTPSNWQEKEVYDWGLGARDLPGWLKGLKKMMPDHLQASIRKDGVELVDNDSAMNAATDSSSRGNSAEDKGEVHVLESHARSQFRPQPRGREHDLPSLD